METKELDKKTLLEILSQGVKNSRIAFDTSKLTLEEEYALCTRSWDYDDHDIDDDDGHSSARISRKEIEDFLDGALEQGSAESTFPSTNCFHSRARYSEGRYEEVNLDNYEGKVKVNLSIKEKVHFNFVPSVPQKPRIRLNSRDYFFWRKNDN